MIDVIFLLPGLTVIFVGRSRASAKFKTGLAAKIRLGKKFMLLLLHVQQAAKRENNCTFAGLHFLVGISVYSASTVVCDNIGKDIFSWRRLSFHLCVVLLPDFP